MPLIEMGMQIHETRPDQTLQQINPRQIRRQIRRNISGDQLGTGDNLSDLACFNFQMHCCQLASLKPPWVN
jgi:hypothetical protein